MPAVEILSAVATIIGVSVKELQDKVNEYLKRRESTKSEQQRNERFAQIGAISRNNLDTKLLRQYYERRIAGDDSYFYSYTVDDHKILTNSLTKPDWNSRTIPLSLDDSSCSLVDQKIDLKLPSLDRVSRLLAVLDSKDLDLRDRPIYRMTDFELDKSRYHSAFALTPFFSYKFTMGLIIDELYEALIDTGHDFDAILSNRTKWLAVREMLLPSRQAVLSPKKRMCAGGVFVVFAMARPAPDNDYQILTQIRSAKVADNQGSISVIPRAFHQHMCNEDEEINILRTVFREIYEELYNGKEVEGSTKNLRADHFLQYTPAVKWLRENIDKITIELISYGFNGLSGNYEYGILFAIHDPYFWNNHTEKIHLNWESDKAPRGHSSRNAKALSSLLRDGNWATETLPPMIEGLIRLKELAPDKVNLPDIQRVVDR